MFLTNLLAGCTHPICIFLNQQNGILKPVSLHGAQTDNMFGSSAFALSYFFDSQNVYPVVSWDFFSLPNFCVSVVRNLLFRKREKLLVINCLTVYFEGDQ